MDWSNFWAWVGQISVFVFLFPFYSVFISLGIALLAYGVNSLRKPKTKTYSEIFHGGDDQ